MNISVAMASYNGELYIEEQVESIASQLSDNDEIIISDDGSTDNTKYILEKLKNKYKFIKVIEGPQKGLIKNFENALNTCKNEIICLSDQDDIWVNDKVHVIKQIFEENKKIALILHNMDIFNSSGLLRTAVIKYHKGVFLNIISSCYWGCCMSFKHELLDIILPFPQFIPAHDQFIGLIGENIKKVYFIDKTLIKHRLHNNNKTGKRRIYKRIEFRIKLIVSYLYVSHK